MTLKQIKRDYRATFEAYKDAEKQGDKEAMQRHAHDLVHLADLMESMT